MQTPVSLKESQRQWENAKKGLEHILSHESQFAQQGVSRSEIADFVFQAATKGTKVGNQGVSRTIYEVVYKGETRRVAVIVSENGFIVGANPVSSTIKK